VSRDLEQGADPVEDRPTLELTGIWKSFSGVPAVRGVDIAIKPGEVVVLLGENGAGKSTLLKVMSGVHRPDRGTIRHRGEAVTIESPRDAQRLGISLVHQELNLVPNGSVAKNLLIGREPLYAFPLRPFGVVDRRRARREAREALAQVHADIDVDATVSRLSVAQQQLVEIARAISTEGTEVVLMDEPTAALPEANVRELLDLIFALRNRGLSIVMTTHRLTEAFEVADRIFVMRDGERVAEVRRDDEQATHEQVIRWMVGRPISALFPERPQERVPRNGAVLEVRGLTSDAVSDVSFDVSAGEILGFGGLVGAGRTELARCLFGVDRRHAGEVRIDGEPVPISTPADAVRAGIGLVPEDRKSQGLIQDLSVRHNLLLAGLERAGRFGSVRVRDIDELATRSMQRFDIRARSNRQLVRLLSGGNQQKVVLAKWLLRPLRVLVLDEPTRGVDVGARAEIYDIVREVAASGTAVLLLSSDMEELIGLSDRIAVMAGGRIETFLDGADITSERILASASRLQATVGAPVGRSDSA
jgi:ABC-type sugar transport system ATPase subunit